MRGSLLYALSALKIFMSSVNTCRLGRMVAMFKYSTVTTYSVFLPPKKLEFSSSIKGEFLKQEFDDVCALISVPFFFLCTHAFICLAVRELYMWYCSY